MVPAPHLLLKFPHFSTPFNSKLYFFSLFRKQMSKLYKQTKPQNIKTQNNDNPHSQKQEKQTYINKQTTTKTIRNTKLTTIT